MLWTQHSKNLRILLLEVRFAVPVTLNKDKIRACFNVLWNTKDHLMTK